MGEEEQERSEGQSKRAAEIWVDSFPSRPLPDMIYDLVSDVRLIDSQLTGLEPHLGVINENLRYVDQYVQMLKGLHRAYMARGNGKYRHRLEEHWSQEEMERFDDVVSCFGRTNSFSCQLPLEKAIRKARIKVRGENLYFWDYWFGFHTNLFQKKAVKLKRNSQDFVEIMDRMSEGKETKWINTFVRGPKPKAEQLTPPAKSSIQ